MPRSRLIWAWDAEEGPTVDPAPGVGRWIPCPWFVSGLEVAAARSVAAHKNRARRNPLHTLSLLLSQGAVILVLEGHCLMPADTVSPVPPGWPGTANEGCLAFLVVGILRALTPQSEGAAGCGTSCAFEGRQLGKLEVNLPLFICFSFTARSDMSFFLFF